MNNKILAIIIILFIAVTLGAVIFISDNKQEDKDQEKSSQQQEFEIGKRAQVIVAENGFEPSTLIIDVNDVVTWINNSGDTATVNSDDHPTNSINKLLNLGQFDDGSSVQIFFTEPGTYTYHNHLNPEQKGTIIVE